MNVKIEDLLKLSPAERIELAEILWDSVAAHPEDFPSLTDAQKAELDRRMADHERDPSTAVSWEVVRAKLWSKVT